MSRESSAAVQMGFSINFREAEYYAKKPEFNYNSLRTVHESEENREESRVERLNRMAYGIGGGYALK